MANKRRFGGKLIVGGIANAVLIACPDTNNGEDIVCRHCVPVATKMIWLATLKQIGFAGTHRLTEVWQCEVCCHQYAIEFEAKHG